MRLCLQRHAFVWIAAVMVAMPSATTCPAAISNGSIITNNAAAAEEKRILLFHDAQQSFEEKLKVGRELYNQKQENRAKVIAAMASQLEARQQTVVMQPVVAPDTDGEIPESGFSPFWAAFAIGV